MATADTRQIRERIVRINIRMPPAMHGSDRDAVGANSTQVVDRLALQRELSRVVSGEVRVRLDHGSAVVVGRRSPMSLYDKALATYDEGDAFDHASAVGFIEIFGLPLRVEAARHGAVGKHHGAAWTWTDPLLDTLPTTVADPEPAGV